MIPDPYAKYISIAVLMLIAGDMLRLFFGARATGKWSIAEGKILESRVIVSTDSDEQKYVPRVRYTYTVKSQSYESNCLTRMSLSCGTELETQEYLEGFEVGNRVLVWYDERNPSKAVLIRGHNYWPLFGVAICIILALPVLLYM